MKKLFILSILLSTLAFSGCETVKEIDSALYGLSNEVARKDNITGRRTLSLHDREAQIQQGDKYAVELIQQFKAKGVKINEACDPEMYWRLESVFKKIHSISHYNDEDWQVVLVDADEFNAFVNGGTYVFVFSGLMNQVNDDELAAVLGHEIAHVVANHMGEQRSHAIASMLSGSESIKRDSFAAAFTHENEEEADMVGILYTALAGYNPFAARDIWQRMYDQSGDAWTGRVHDHPVYSERSAATEELARKVLGYYEPGQVNPHASELLNKNVLWDNSGICNIQGGEGGGILAVLEAAADSYMRHQEAKTEEYRQTAKNSFVSGVRNSITFRNLKVVNWDTFQVEFYYTGYQVLKDIHFECHVQDDIVVRTNSGGPIYPYNTYIIRFHDQRLRSVYSAPPIENIRVLNAE